MTKETAMTSLSDIVAASQDGELALKVAAAAAVAGVPEESLQWAYSNSFRLAAQAVDGGTVASHHAAGTLTDEHLLAAVRAVAEI